MNPESTFRSLLLVGVLSAFSTGCSLVSVDNKTRYRDAEGYFEPHLLDQIKPGETSEDWMREHFGRPWLSEVDALAGYPSDLGIDTWRFERERQKNTRVFLLFRSRKLDQQYEYLHIVTEGDTVIRAWRDELDTVDTRRLLAAMGYAKVGVGERSSFGERGNPGATRIDKHEVEPSTKPAASMQESWPEDVDESAAAHVQSVPPPAALKVEDVPPAANVPPAASAPAAVNVSPAANAPPAPIVAASNRKVGTTADNKLVKAGETKTAAGISPASETKPAGAPKNDGKAKVEPGVEAGPGGQVSLEDQASQKDQTQRESKTTNPGSGAKVAAETKSPPPADL